MSKATEFYGKGVDWFKKEHKAKIMAVQALHTGTASEHQQKMALAFIIKNLCRTDDFNYFPDSDRDTAFALGRESVGKALRGFAIDPNWASGE